MTIRYIIRDLVSNKYVSGFHWYSPELSRSVKNARTYDKREHANKHLCEIVTDRLGESKQFNDALFEVVEVVKGRGR